MYSESCRTIAAMLNGYISSCSPEQVQELKQLLIDTISDIENDNLTQEKDTDSTEQEEEKQRRAPNVIYDKELAQRVFNMAKKFPNCSMDNLDKKLGLPDTTIRTAKAKIMFMGEYRKLNNICKLGRLMSSERDNRRYRREINDYDDME